VPTARELLEEVDALMRRNRGAAGNAPAQEALATSPNDDIPVLTEEAALEPEEHDKALLDDVPLLTDAVELAEIEPAAPEQAGGDDDEQAWIGGLPADAFGVVAASMAAHATARPEAQSRLSAEDPRWASLAEDIRTQVLQRVDLFTEQGLSERLQPHLQGIVERASAELVATINAQVGQVLRAYIAEAIEREIEKWRHDTS